MHETPGASLPPSWGALSRACDNAHPELMQATCPAAPSESRATKPLNRPSGPADRPLALGSAQRARRPAKRSHRMHILRHVGLHWCHGERARIAEKHRRQSSDVFRKLPIPMGAMGDGPIRCSHASRPFTQALYGLSLPGRR